MKDLYIFSLHECASRNLNMKHLDSLATRVKKGVKEAVRYRKASCLAVRVAHKSADAFIFDDTKDKS